MIDPGKIVDKVVSAVDDNVYSRQESEEDRTSRHLADMKSDNPLAKMIRPMMAIWAMVINSVLWVAIYFQIEIEASIIYTAGGVLISIIGFYFESRRAEKINSRNAAAAIQIQKMEIRETRRENRRKRKRNG